MAVQHWLMANIAVTERLSPSRTPVVDAFTGKSCPLTCQWRVERLKDEIHLFTKEAGIPNRMQISRKGATGTALKHLTISRVMPPHWWLLNPCAVASN